MTDETTKDQTAEEAPPATQTPIGGEIDGTQSPDPISDPSQKETAEK